MLRRPANGRSPSAGSTWRRVPGALEAATAGHPNFVVKGGSWLCAPQFCARHRPSARQAQEADLGTGHVGFRTVSRPPPG